MSVNYAENKYLSDMSILIIENINLSAVYYLIKVDKILVISRMFSQSSYR